VKLKAAYYDGPKQVTAAISGQVDAANAGPAPVPFPEITVLAPVAGSTAMMVLVFGAPFS